MRNDLPKAITAEDVIRRFDLSSLVKDRRKINENKQGLDKTENILYNFIDGILKGLNNTENQVDGKVSTWFFTGVPTLESNPASSWDTDVLKNSHIGDLYYDKANGNTYQFIFENEEYLWQQVTDSDVNESMALANANPDTSDGLRDIFVVNPIPPYKVGDIWIKSNGDIYRCIVARSEGDLNEAEWVISSEYANDNYVHDARAILDSFTEFVTANYVCKVLVKTTKDSIDLSVSSATTKITNDYTTAINESEGRAVIRENGVLLSAKSYTTSEIARVEGEIGDIADITKTNESDTAKVSFTEIPESEPINILIHPISENIDYLYPSGNVYPSSTLFPKIKTLRFINTTDFELTEDEYYTDYRKYYTYDGAEYDLLVAGTDYTIGSEIIGNIYQNTYIDYEIPDCLLYYDSETYDTFEMDYDAQICKIVKRCKYNNDGTIGVLDNPVTTNYPYPQINLRYGNYDIELLGYTTGYMFVRLMSNNAYVGQFATKTQLDAAVTILPHTIELTTAEKVSGTQCGITIKLRDANGNELDSKEANITLSGLVKFTDLSNSNNYTTINGSNIKTGTIDASLVNVTNINATNITAGTLKSSNYVANTSGTKIDMANGLIDSKNFKVDSNGNVSITGYVHATSGTIGGCNIVGDKLQIENANIGTISGDKIRGGTITGTTISGDVINGGTINGNSVSLTNIDANNITSGTISGASISVGSSNYYLRMGRTWTKHPEVSGLNVGGGGINLNGNDIQAPRKVVATSTALLLCSTADSVKIGNTNSLNSTAPIEVYQSKCYANQYFEVTTVNHYVRKSNGNRISLSAYINEGSSRKIKENIQPIDSSFVDALYNEVKELKLYSYDYKKSYMEEDRFNKYGFMIDDVEDKNISKLLDIETGKNYSLYSGKGLAKLDLILIKELMKKIDDLERRLNNE